MVTGYNIAWYNTGEPHTVEAEFGEGEYRRRADAERYVKRCNLAAARLAQQNPPSLGREETDTVLRDVAEGCRAVPSGASILSRIFYAELTAS